MTVWVLVVGSYEDARAWGVFTSHELAQQAYERSFGPVEWNEYRYLDADANDLPEYHTIARWDVEWAEILPFKLDA